MMPPSNSVLEIRALLIEDNPSDAELLQESLDDSTFGRVKIEWVEDLAKGLEQLASQRFDILLLDLSLPDSHSLDSLRILRANFPELPIVILTGLDDSDVAVDAVKQGAQDFLVKGKPSGESIYRCMRYAIERQHSDALMRKSAADAYEAKVNLQLAVATSGMGIYSWDLTSGKVTWDQRVNEIFGVDSEVTDLKLISRLIPPEDLQRLRISLEECLERGDKECEVEFRATISNGRTRYLSSRARAFFDEEGRPVRLTGVVSDNTRQMEEQKSKRRLALLEQREEFIAMLAHDLRTPIYGAQRMIEFLIQGALGDIPPAQSEVLSKISVSNQGILHSINNVLDVYSLEANSNPLPVLVTRDLNLTISACVEQMEPIAKASGLKLIWTPVPLNPVSIDDMAVSRIITNLLSNAVKFTPSGGQIEISVKECEGKACLQVTDNGIGMEQAVAEKIFDRFYQSSRKYRGKGLGLGLYLCKQLVEAMGGTITCASTPGEGTTFEVKFSLARRGAWLRKSVLVVDDNRLNQQVLQAFLEKMSFDADAVHSGKEAIWAAKQKHYDVIFVDFMMPVMDGMATSKALRESGVNSPIFCYSANDPLELKLEGSGFDDFLEKAIDNAKLKRLLTKWLPRDIALEQTRREPVAI